MNLDNLKETHPVYKKNLSRHNFLYNSYVGGLSYKEGEYLRKYWGEDDAPFDAYGARIDVTPLDNHVRTTVDIYRSYLWRNHPNRVFGKTRANPFLEDFLNDTDLDGQGLDSFLKTSLDWSMVLGYVWINIDRPNVTVNSAADELEQGIRAYASMFTPQMVPDWRFERSITGKRSLTYIKVYEFCSEDLHIIKEWYTDKVIKTTVKVDPNTGDYVDVLSTEEMVNTLGKIPFIYLAPQKSPTNGIGESILGDVADVQRSIYNKLSELEQTIRISGHPTLVKTMDTSAQAGAGGIVTIPDDLDPGLYPSILQPAGSVDSILKAIEHDIESIDKMTHLGAVRAVKGSGMSGEALKTERQLLNSKLSDLADAIEETEYKIWDLWFDWMEMETPADFVIEYYKTFDTKDASYEIAILQKALETITDKEYIKYAQKEIAKLTIDDEDVLDRILNSIDSNEVVQLIEPFE